MSAANRHERDKIRQQLEVLRDLGLVEFLGGGKYRARDTGYGTRDTGKRIQDTGKGIRGLG